MTKVGQMFLLGLAGETDHLEAELWLEKTANLGCHNAMHTLGEFYWKTKGPLQNTEKAASYLKKAALLGNDRSLISLVKVYSKAKCVWDSAKV